jgi:ABC-2 type transport system permease protein
MTFFDKLIVLESKQFLRNRITWLGFSIIISIGIYSILQGKDIINQQIKVIEQVEEIQAKQMETHLNHHSDHEIGTLLYYQFFHTKNEPTVWAAFSVGQRDINPYTLKVRMLAVEGQLYDTELTNPNTLLAGNLDLSFVFIFLFPLLIISLTYNILSAEQESGVWALVGSQPISTAKVLFLKILVRFMALLFAMGLLVITAVVMLNLPVNTSLLLVIVLLLAYLVFWFLVVFMVILLKKSSTSNAVTLLSAWLCLLILLPALANVLITKFIPIPEALETTVKQREAYHEKWDMPKSTVMEPFFQRYPQYKNYPIPDDQFSYAWYYAMMFAADNEAGNSASDLFDKLEKRQEVSRAIGYFIPNLFLQNEFNRLAKTDLATHVAYLKSVKAFHRQLAEFFYPHIFEMDLPGEINWEELPEYHFDVGY